MKVLASNPWFWIAMHWAGNAILAVIPVVAAFIGVRVTNRTNERIQTIRLQGDETLLKTRLEEDRRILESRSAQEAAIRERSIKRDRGEEIYTLMETWMGAVRKFTLEYAKAVAGQPTAPFPDALVDMSKPLRSKMLIVVHFPHLEPHWKATVDEFQKIFETPDPGSSREARQARLHSALQSMAKRNLDLLAFVTKELSKIPF